jgi:hypothetical protein
VVGKVQIVVQEGDAALIECASKSLREFYTDVDVSLLDGGPLLTSVSRGDAELSALWQTVISNERLHSRAHARRLELLAALS